MLFSSWQFMFMFLPATFVVYFALNRRRLVIAGKSWLVAASLFFYAYWDIAYLPLILTSILLNYATGTGLARSCPAGTQPKASRRQGVNRKFVLAAGITANLLLLTYYKYTDFLIENINSILHTSFPLQHIGLPLAISFFTFTQIVYLVDSYRGETAEYDLLNYSLFVTFFPHLIAGPIVHHGQIMPQFASRWTLSRRNSNILKGLLIFSIGLFKKVVIADSFSVWADNGFDGGRTLDFFEAWATSLSYTFQLYFDFSGYCDMAIGASLFFNIWLPLNFNSPYKALNIQDFWRRWHITLSSFLRDFLYIPLGGNRGTQFRTHFNLLLTFVLGGLWHGATWMFVIWGGLHGGALIAHRIWSRSGLVMPRPLGWLLTFSFVNVGWVFFRAKTLDDAQRVLNGMTNIGSAIGRPLSETRTADLAWAGWMADRLLPVFPASFIGQLPIYLAIATAFALISRRNSMEITQAPMTNGKLAFAIAMFLIATHFILAKTNSVFLYFNF